MVDKYSEMDKRERGEQGLNDLRALLEEIAEVGSSVLPGIDGVRDAAVALEGLDRAELAIRKWRERDTDGNWRCEEEALEEKPDTHTVEDLHDIHADRRGQREATELDTEEALSMLREAASDELREASLEEVLQRTLGDDEDVLVVDHQTAPMLIARMHIVDALPPHDAQRSSVEVIADECDRDEEYVREELERLAELDVADLGWDGARLAHRRVVVEPLAGREEE
jgi:hypothetical protein